MFKRIFYENWTEMVPQLSFWLTFIVFLAIVARAVFLKKDTVRHLEALPFEEEERPNPKKKDPS